MLRPNVKKKNRQWLTIILIGAISLLAFVVILLWQNNSANIKISPIGVPNIDSMPEKVQEIGMKVPEHSNVAKSMPSTFMATPITLNSGYVFIDGKYIDSPYIISMDSKGIYINGLQAFKYVAPPSPASHSNKSPDAVDPGIPEWVTKDSHISDLVFPKNKEDESLLDKKWGSIIKLHTLEESAEEMVKYIKSLPCIKAVELDDVPKNNCVSITIKELNGRQLGMDFEYIQSTSSAAKNDSAVSHEANNDCVKKMLDEIALIKDRLEDDGAIFTFHGSSFFMLNKKTMASTFPLIMKTVESSKTRKEKLDVLVRLRILIGREALVDNCVIDKQLRERINNLVEETGIKPISFDELPANPFNIIPRTRPATNDAPKETPENQCKRFEDIRVESFVIKQDNKKLLHNKGNQIDDDLRSKVINCAQSQDEIQAWQTVLNQPWTREAVEFAGYCLMEDWDKVSAPPLERPKSIYKLLAFTRINEKPLAYDDKGKPVIAQSEYKRVSELKSAIDAIFDKYYCEITNEQSRWSKDVRQSLISDASDFLEFQNNPQFITENIWSRMAIDDYFCQCMLGVIDTNANPAILQRLKQFRSSSKWNEDTLARIDDAIKSSQRWISRSNSSTSENASNNSDYVLSDDLTKAVHKRLEQLKSGKCINIPMTISFPSKELFDDMSVEYSKEHYPAKAACNINRDDNIIKMLDNGVIDLGVIHSSVGQSQLESQVSKGMKKHTLASRSVAIVVNSVNKLDSITLDQVRDIFTGKISDWNIVGKDLVPAGTGDVSSPVFVGPNKPSLDARRGMVLYGLANTIPGTPGNLQDPYCAVLSRAIGQSKLESYQAKKDSAEVLSAVSIDPAGIGFVDASQLIAAAGKGIKVLAIGELGKAILPQYKAILDGTYPLSEPITLYFMPKPDPAGTTQPATTQPATSPADLAYKIINMPTSQPAMTPEQTKADFVAFIVSGEPVETFRKHGLVCQGMEIIPPPLATKPAVEPENNPKDKHKKPSKPADAQPSKPDLPVWK